MSMQGFRFNPRTCGGSVPRSKTKRMYQPLSAFTTMVFAVEETIVPEVVRYLAQKWEKGRGTLSPSLLGGVIRGAD
jgi:hypothetical protein